MSSGKTLIDHASNPVKSKLINGSTGSATGYGDLEDYIMELQSRSLQNGSSENDKNGINIGNSVNSVINGETNVDPTELLLQLAQKEKDLILAAELGKALLERNEQLTRANERITEEYSHKLEHYFKSVSLRFLFLVFNKFFSCQQIDAMFKQREVTSFSKILFVLMNVHLQPVV